MSASNAVLYLRPARVRAPTDDAGTLLEHCEPSAKQCQRVYRHLQYADRRASGLTYTEKARRSIDAHDAGSRRDALGPGVRGGGMIEAAPVQPASCMVTSSPP